MTPAPLPPGLPEVLGGIAAALKSRFGPHLHVYAQSIKDSRSFHPIRSKVINDSIWKTVRLDPWEVVVLDSPIVQRLRNVRQLGLAHLVYPTAGYSRFEHSLGTLHQTQRIIEALDHNARAARRGIEPILPNDATLLRLTALLHDVGHGFLSHVSERAMERISPFPFGGTASDARREAQTYFNCRKKPAFSEVLSALLVRLPEFEEVLDAANVPDWTAPELSQRLAELITGGAPYPLRPFLSEIISGAVDADKLDYMVRDCYMAGLPMPVDVERVLQKIQAVAVGSDSVPGAPWAKYAGIPPGRTIYLLSIEQSGGRAVEEMLVSRVLLYDKLYKHQKVRAFEGMTENALDVLMENAEAFRSPETYLTITDDQLLSGAWGDIDVPSAIKDRVMDLIDRIHKRETVRAFAFGPSLLESDPVQWVDKKPAFLRWSPESREFRHQIVVRAQAYLKKNGQADLADLLNDDLLVIDFPDAQRIAERTRFYIGNETAGLRLYSEAFGVDRWMEAYEHSKSVGYVFCPREYAAAAYAAVRDEVESMNLSFDDRRLTLTKVSPQDVRALDVAAGKTPVGPTLTGWHPTPPSVERSEIEIRFGSQIRVLVERFKPYEYRPVDATTIVEWLHQFPRRHSAGADTTRTHSLLVASRSGKWLSSRYPASDAQRWRGPVCSNRRRHHQRCSSAVLMERHHC